jgi:superkiller protein 3
MRQKFAYAALCLLLCGISTYAQKKTFVRDYTYQAGEMDSKATAWANATSQMRSRLLVEVGEFLHAERTLAKTAGSQDFAEKVEAITAGVVEMKTLDERWDGVTYYIKAEMTVDPGELARQIDETLNNKQKTRELEESRRRTQVAEAESKKLKKELVESKSKPQREALQKNYLQAADALSAEEYFIRGKNATQNGWHELSVEYYQKAVALNPSHAWAYTNMGNAYNELENYSEAIRCYQKAIAVDPNEAFAYSNMGVAYGNLENDAEALRCYQKAVAIDSGYAAAYYNMGGAYGNLENYSEAIRCYQKFIAIAPSDPDVADAYFYMGSSYGNLENHTEAVRYIKKAAQMRHGEAQEWLQDNGHSW